jgi:hypothetical protein
MPAWNFSNGVLRWLFHGNSLSPVRKTCSSHFSSATDKVNSTAALQAPL